MKNSKFFLCLLIFSSLELFSDQEKAKEEFVYDLSLATQGVMVSQYNTGVNYSLGLGIHVDMEKSIYWFQEATKQGHSKAPFNLAIIYARGGKVSKDLTLSETYFLLSAERGNKEAKDFIQKVFASQIKKTHEAIEILCCPELLVHATAIPFGD
ncbi:MAG: hypothetical protein CMD69_04065 [Gammaproteobacteria bacterium]|nr:hypothetical protein [Gammaproteobacteria bacterium]